MTILANCYLVSEQRRKPMPRENYRRIVKGYEPIEPAGFFEKVFYLLWLPVCVFQILLVGVKRYRIKDGKSK